MLVYRILSKIELSSQITIKLYHLMLDNYATYTITCNIVRLRKRTLIILKLQMKKFKNPLILIFVLAIGSLICFADYMCFKELIQKKNAKNFRLLLSDNMSP